MTDVTKLFDLAQLSEASYADFSDANKTSMGSDSIEK